MNALLNKSLTFVFVFVIAISFSGCGSTGANAPTANNVNQVAVNSTGNTTGNTNKPASLFPPLATGVAQADLELLDGTKFKAADRKGKVLLLNLWATWCGPCRAEMPHLVEMYDKYKDRDFQVIGLDVGDGNGSPETVEEIKAFAAKMKLNYELVRISNATVSEVYKLTRFEGVPQTLLVDREGHLRGVFLGGGSKVIDSMKAEVDKLMAEK